MIRNILIAIVLGLLVWLLIDNTFQIDIAATKNDGLINSEKIKVDDFQNIDSVKTYAKSRLDIIQQNRKRDSIIATKRIWIIIGIIFLQTIVLTFSKHEKKIILKSKKNGNSDLC